MWRREHSHLGRPPIPSHRIHFVSKLNLDVLYRTGKNIVPGSDCSGKVIAVGASVRGFELGDRVSANFNPEHIYGDISSAEQRNAAFGSQVDGVLTEYRTFPAYVSSSQFRDFEIQ